MFPRFHYGNGDQIKLEHYKFKLVIEKSRNCIDSKRTLLNIKNTTRSITIYETETKPL